MKRRKSWLQTAVRVYEVQTLNHRQHTNQARGMLERAAGQYEQAGQAMQGLARTWTELRSEALLTPDLDTAYQRFHAYLEQRAAEAAQTWRDAQVTLDAAAQQLKTTHATQHMLQRVSDRAAMRFAQEALGREHHAMAEAWLLGRLSKDEST